VSEAPQTASPCHLHELQTYFRTERNIKHSWHTLNKTFIAIRSWFGNVTLGLAINFFQTLHHKYYTNVNCCPAEVRNHRKHHHNNYKFNTLITPCNQLNNWITNSKYTAYTLHLSKLAWCWTFAITSPTVNCFWIFFTVGNSNKLSTK